MSVPLIAFSHPWIWGANVRETGKGIVINIDRPTYDTLFQLSDKIYICNENNQLSSTNKLLYSFFSNICLHN